MTELDAEDAKLVVLARGAMGRAEAGSGAAVRDLDGRTYAGAPVALDALSADGAAGRRGGGGVQRRGGSGGRGAGRRVRPTTPGWPRCASCRPDAAVIVTDRARESASAVSRIPFRLRLFRRQAQHRQVDADQRAGRHQGGHHLEPAADHPAHHPRHRAPRGLPDHPRRHPGSAPAAHPARAAAQRTGQGHLLRGRRHRAVHPGRRGASAPATGGSTSRSAPSRRGPRWSSIVTKIDKVSKERVAAQLMAVSELTGADCRDRARCRRPPVSRSTCSIDVLVAQLPPGPGVLPRRRADRRARGSPDGRADPRGRAGRRARRAAALAGRRHRRGRARAKDRDDL